MVPNTGECPHRNAENNSRKADLNRLHNIEEHIAADIRLHQPYHISRQGYEHPDGEQNSKTIVMTRSLVVSSASSSSAN